MTRFRQALLDELLTRVADPAVPAAPAPHTPRRRPRLVLAASGLAALAVAGGAGSNAKVHDAGVRGER